MRALLSSSSLVGAFMFATCAEAMLWPQAPSVEAPQAAPRFEVASVKIVPPTASEPNHVVKTRGRIRYTGAYMWQILATAFQMQPDQFLGPDWVKESRSGPRLEIVATFEPTASDDEVNAMMKNLLQERFNLAYHLGKKEFEVYELVVATGGPKLQEAEIPTELPTMPKGPSPHRNGPDGYPILPAGWPAGVGTAANGNMYINLMSFAGFSPVPSNEFMADLGLLRFSFRMVTVPQLLRMLQRICGIPHAVDRTGLQGKYDIRLAFSRGVPEPGRAVDVASDPAPSVFSALEKQLGLQLKKVRVPLDVIVIDHLDRTPVGN